LQKTAISIAEARSSAGNRYSLVVLGPVTYKRLTLVVDGATIEHVFYPVFPPGSHADEVLDWLRANPVTPA